MPAQTKDCFVGFWATPEQRERIKEAARLDGRSVSSFSRFHLLRFVDSVLGEKRVEKSAPMHQAA